MTSFSYNCNICDKKFKMNYEETILLISLKKIVDFLAAFKVYRHYKQKHKEFKITLDIKKRYIKLFLDIFPLLIVDIIKLPLMLLLVILYLLYLGLEKMFDVVGNLW